MGYIGNAPFGGQITGDNVLDGSIKAEDLAPGAAVPTQTGQSGKYLTTDGTTASWGTVSQVPSQTGQTGKYLTTDGTTASWSTVATGVRVTGITYSGNDLATSPNGGQTVTLAGSGFASTPTVFVDGTIAPSVSFVSSSQITFVTPAKSAGTYHVYVVNPDGSTAIFVNGISYSGVPTWTTAAGSLGTYTGTFSIQLVATGDAPITYTLATGSSLPAGVALSSSGLISGTLGTEQTFSFSVDAVDAQNQETPRSFSVTVVLSDPYFEYNALLLSGNGANGSQNNTFLDGSTNNFTITRNGNTTQGTFSPFSQTGWGVYFNGSSDYISVADSADFTMGSGDFTIQCWVYSTANSGSDQYILGQVPSTGAAASTSFQLYKKATTNVAECYVYIGGSKVATSTATIPVGQWTHLAMVRDGGTMRLYVNGSQDGTNATLSTSSIVDSTGSFSVGRTGDYNGLYFAGYVSNVSVVKGTCLFPNGTTFTPSTTPLSTSTSGQSVLLCQANRFIDTNTATTAKTVTVGSTASIQAFSPFNPTAAWSAATNGGSGYFDGSGDFLACPDNAALEPGSSDLTWEMWINTTSTTQYATLYSRTTATFASGMWSLMINFASGTAGDVALFVGDYSTSVGFLYANTVNVRDGAWHHIAVVRSGSAWTLYVDGVSRATGTFAGTIADISGGPYVGRDQFYGRDFAGYISGLRIVKGTAVYTAGFTPPTAPPTAITNTSLLLNYTNAGIYDATSKNDLETVGNAQISTTQSKFGGSSMYFDGTGDWLVSPYRPQLDIPSGDWTVECWIYPTSTATKTVFAINSASSSYAQVQVAMSSGGAWYLLIGTGAATWLSTSTGGSYSTNTWYHVAAVRNGSNFNLYINGTSVLSQSSSSNLYAYNSPSYIGADGALGQNFVGYIDDLRITKGIARYTSNFTPPTTAFKLR